MRKAQLNGPKRHCLVTGLEDEDHSMWFADLWPGDEVDLKLPNGLVVYLKVSNDGFLEYR